MPVNLLTPGIRALLDDRASDLASHDNTPEAAWFLRGVADALAGVVLTKPEGGPSYARFYNSGYIAVRNAREKVEV